jgi:hypothetical protein
MNLPAQAGVTDLRGPYDIAYLGYEGPREAAAGAEVRARLRIKNASFRVLSSRADEDPDFVSYHWLGRDHTPVVKEGERSPLPRDLPPGDEMEVSLKIIAPDAPGSYLLAIDLVQEGKVWFSDAGTPTLDIPFDCEHRWWLAGYAPILPRTRTRLSSTRLSDQMNTGSNSGSSQMSRKLV